VGKIIRIKMTSPSRDETDKSIISVNIATSAATTSTSAATTTTSTS